MNNVDIRIAIKKKYNDSRRYAIAEEVGLTTGYSHRRLDMMVLDCYNSNGFRIDGFEIKISTNDLRRELEDPEKHVAFFDIIDYYTLAAPAGVVDPLMDIIPKKWGILIVNEDGTTRFKRKPLALEDRKADKDVPRGFLAAIVRALQARQPYMQELEKEYERGFEAGKKQTKATREYRIRCVDEKYDKINKYEELMLRLNVHSEERFEEVLDAFDKFGSLRIDYLNVEITELLRHLNKIKGILNAKED